MAHPLGSHFSIPHGVICGLLLPYTMEYNPPYATEKYAEVHRLMGGAPGEDTDAAARAAVEGVRALLGRIGIPARLGDFGVREEHLPQIIAESLPSGSLQHNPRPLAADDVRAILTAAL